MIPFLGSVPFLLIVASVIGVIASYTDIRKGIIPNIVVLAGLVLALAVNILDLQFTSYFELATNLFFAFLLGFVLYAANLWSAGDAKLFIAFAALIPVSFYAGSYSPFFPSFALLINTFSPIFIYFFAKLLYQTTWTQKKEAFLKSTEPRKLAKLAVALFAISWIIDTMFRISGIPFNLVLTAIIVFFILELAEELFRINEFLLLGGLSVLVLLLDFQSVSSPFFWQFYLILLVSFIFLRFFVLYMGIHVFGKKIPIPELKPGMVPLDMVIEKEGFYKIRPGFYPTLFQVMDDSLERFMVNMSPTGLTKEDVANLRKWEKEGNLSESRLTVQETLPFAPFLFLGVLLTLFLKGDIVFYLADLLL